ncbi:MAG: hypothetical protein HYU88_13400 [Chloroflexi bacterium]|nr:hypothetical protein [Chloroflexota bacterium]MBI4507970.1 hypothetical protein [Chloroflexota bacterium]
MWSFVLGFALGVVAGMLAQTSMRPSASFDQQLGELRERVDSMLQRSRDLLAETRSEVEALRQRVTRGERAAGAQQVEAPGGPGE